MHDDQRSSRFSRSRNERVDGRHRAARRDHAMHGHRVVGEVRTVDGKHITTPETALGQTDREASHERRELAVGNGQAGGAVNQRRLAVKPFGVLQHIACQRDLGNLDIGEWTAYDHECAPSCSRTFRQ